MWVFLLALLRVMWSMRWAVVISDTVMGGYASSCSCRGFNDMIAYLIPLRTLKAANASTGAASYFRYLILILICLVLVFYSLREFRVSPVDKGGIKVYLSIRCTPLAVSTIPLISPGFNANAACSNSFCISPGPKKPLYHTLKVSTRHQPFKKF